MEKIFGINLKPMLILAIINVFVLAAFIMEGQIMHGIGYFLFFYAAVAAINFLCPKENSGILVKKPASELKTVIIFTLIGIVAISANFYLRSANPSLGLIARIPILAAMILFTFPIALFIYLFIKKYKPTEIGFKYKPLKIYLTGTIVWAITGIVALLFNPSGMLWSKALAEMGGVMGFFVQSIVASALAEESMRYILQTRIAKFVGDSSYSIIIATVVWAFIHFPVAYFNSGRIWGPLLYCIIIIPLGFVWGYLSERTRSILPSVLAHGFNLWGLQNG